MAKKEGRRCVYIYRSRVYNSGGGMSDEELNALLSEMGPILLPFIRSTRGMPPGTMYTLVRMHVEEAMWHLFRAATLMYSVDPRDGASLFTTAHAAAARTAGILSRFEKNIGVNGGRGGGDAGEDSQGGG